MKESGAEDVLVCPHCGSEEFSAPAAARDILRIVGGVPEIIRTEADDFHDLDELVCAKCHESAPPFSKA